MDKTIELEIVSPVRQVFKGKVTSITAPGVEGGFQVLHNHAPLVASLGIGKVKVVLETGETMYYAISGGIFEVNNNTASILAEAIESKEDIDIERAQRAKDRAEEILRMNDKSADLKQVRETIEKAKNRIEIAS